MNPDLRRRAFAEALGTGFLALVVVGSGIMGQRLFPGQDGLALLANSLATGGGLYALILSFASLSGAHFNPAVTLASAALRQQPWIEVPAYLGAQCLGAVLGVAATHAMFALPALQASTHARSGLPLLLSECVGTSLLVFVILQTRRTCPERTPMAVAAVVTGGYWFTASTFFTNPALTVGRALTESFVGIRPGDAPAFILAQLFGAGAAVALGRALSKD